MDSYPVRFRVDYPDRPLNRLTTAFRIFTAIPIAIVVGTTSSAVFASLVLMLLFRQKFPGGGMTGTSSSHVSRTG